MNDAALKGARNYRAFIDAARDIVNASDFAIDEQALSQLQPLVDSAKPVSWTWYLPAGELSLEEVMFELSLNAALNGGYFAKAADGSIRQWEVGGSGSQALLQWLQERREAHEIPGIHLKTPASARLVLADRLAGQPFADERLETLAMFAYDGTRARLADILNDAREDGKLSFALRHADALADLVPSGFGGDPFRKKACLALQMVAGHAAANGFELGSELPIPSDYQIPRILAWQGTILLSDRFAQALQSEAFLDVTSADVTAFRAAAVVACSDLARMAGVEDGVVDGALFTTFRKNPDFKAGALPPMRTDSFWF